MATLAIGERMVGVSVTLPIPKVQTVDLWAAERGTNRSGLIRELIADEEERRAVEPAGAVSA